METNFNSILVLLISVLSESNGYPVSVLPCLRIFVSFFDNFKIIKVNVLKVQERLKFTEAEQKFALFDLQNYSRSNYKKLSEDMKAVAFQRFHYLKNLLTIFNDLTPN